MAPKILQLCAVDFTAFHFLLPLMRAQRSWGFDVELACTPGEFIPRIQAEGFVCHPIQISRSRNPFKLLWSYRQMRRLFTKLRFTAVHVHTPVAALVARPAARRAGVPAIFYTAHGFYFHDAMRPAVRNLYIGLERWAQRSADFLFSQSEEDARSAVANRIELPCRVQTIGNGVDLSRFRPDLLSPGEKTAMLAQFGLAPEDGPIVTIMGRLVREKGYFELLDAWHRVIAEYPRARLLVIGDALPSDHDDSAARIRTRAGELGLLPSVVFAGLRNDVPFLLALSDIFVLPSWREGMPRSIIEAMASGLPVIASDIRGCREEVVDGETGFLVPARESGPLAEAILRLLADPALRTRMGAAGRVRAWEHFSEDSVIQRQKEVYMRTFARKKIPWPQMN